MTADLLTLLARIALFITVHLGFCLFLGVVAVIGVVIFYATRYSSKVDKPSWSTLARINNLEFRPVLFGYIESGSRVFGHYRGYLLELKYKVARYSDSTCLTLSVDQRKEEPFFEIEFPEDQPISAEDIVHLLTPHGWPAKFKGAIRTFHNGFEVYYHQPGRETDIEYLQRIFDLAYDIAEAYPKVVAIGGEAMPALTLLSASGNPLQSVAIELMKSIGSETRQRLHAHALQQLCPYCFVYCAAQTQWVDLTRIVYFGCRNCGQSNEFLEVKGTIVAVLDTRINLKQWEQEGNLYVNWFIHQELFDFEAIEMVWATDEAVEHFVVQVGNDTDSVRTKRYKAVRCRLSLECELSENTSRILSKTFTLEKYS